jgi:hypothetical protein
MFFLVFADAVSLTAESELAEVVRAMARPSSGLKVCNRSWLKITIPNAFIGKKTKPIWFLRPLENNDSMQWTNGSLLFVIAGERVNWYAVKPTDLTRRFVAKL